MAKISLKTKKGYVLILRDKAFISASIWKNKQKKLKIILILPSAVGIALNFGHRSHSRRSKIFSYGRRPSAFGPTLVKMNPNLNVGQ